MTTDRTNAPDAATDPHAARDPDTVTDPDAATDPGAAAADDAPLAIDVAGLGKQYRLGLVGTKTLSHDLNRWWARARGRPDPYARIGERNDRARAGASDYVWALRDVSFRVRRGEVVGVIGANGAGKSTLLKLLCRVTAPTEGTIRLRGRIASLLEVGTGFHRELTGRENVFLNGTLLGMTRAEVAARFDDIVAFAGVERYVDTPIKRYSTGMKVRLAFAVAAHLEPEILIVDEVLAVGDAEFQRKAIGKMKAVAAATARTVLFVSHDMEAIARLCTRCIVLDRGGVAFDGGAVEGIRAYAALNFGKAARARLAERTDRGGTGEVRFTALRLATPDGFPAHYASPGRAIVFECVLACDAPTRIYPAVGLRDSDGATVTLLSSWAQARALDIADGSVLRFEVPSLILPAGEYLVDLYAVSAVLKAHTLDHVEAAAVLEVVGDDFFGTGQSSASYRYRAYQDFTLEATTPT